MGDIAQRGNRLTFARGLHVKKEGVGKPLRGIKLTKRKYEPIQNKALVRDVYEHVAHKHSLGQKKKPHSSKEGRTASAGRALRDVGKIFGSERVGKFGGGRTNLLEELGRVEAEPSNRNRRAEISRVHGELNRGYATGGAVQKIRKGMKIGIEAAKKHVARKEAAKVQAGKDEIQKSDMGYAKGGKVKKDKKWMQKVSASIKKRGTKGKCTPITKPGCTGRAKALAKTFKKIAAKRKAKG